MTYRNGDAKSIAKLSLETGTPDAGTRTVTSARVGQDEETFGMWVVLSTFELPPLHKTVNYERRGFPRGADNDKPTVGYRIVEAVRNRDTNCIRPEIMVQRLQGLLFPGDTGVFEVFAGQRNSVGVDFVGGQLAAGRSQSQAAS